MELIPNVLLTDPALGQSQLDLLAQLCTMTAAFRLSVGGDVAALPGFLENELAPLLGLAGDQPEVGPRHSSASSRGS